MQELISAYGPRFLVAALGVSLALLCLFIVLWILRNRAPSPFVRGGRNRQPRLQVLDAAAVDTRRRIVLIRRDNVEHLVMIGGPTDIVIESGIGDERHYLSAQAGVAQALNEQQSLARPVTPPTLAAEQVTPPLGALAIADEKLPAEAPVVRPAAAEPAKPVPPARPQSTGMQGTEERRPQPMPVRTEAPPAHAPLQTVAPVAAPAAVTAEAVSTFAADREPEQTAEPAAPVLDNAVTFDAVSRPAPKIDSPVTPEIAAFHPTARLEPELTANMNTPAVTDNSGLLAEPAPFRQPERVEPTITAGTPPIEAFRVETVEPVRLDDAAVPAAGSDRPSAAFEPMAVPSASIDPPAIEDVLDAARVRVLTPAPAPAPGNQQSADPVRHAVAAAEPARKREPEVPAKDLSDFERVLEEEMALHLAADPVPPTRHAPELAQILPETRADRPRPPLTVLPPEGARTPAASASTSQQAQEPNLQTEIARIFGEMSASRNN